ncbi:MAG: class I SAM-dependent methyltransferase [Pseudomonadota bacterium]
MYALKLPYTRKGFDLPQRYSLEDFATNKLSLWGWIWQHCDLSLAQRILEVGCGTGDFWLHNINRLPRTLRITCTDISKFVLDKFAIRLGLNRQFSLQTMNVKHLLFAVNQFDIIFAHNILHLLDEPLQALLNLNQALKSQGQFFALVPTTNTHRKLYQLANEIYSSSIFAKLYEFDSIESVLSKEFVIAGKYQYQNEYHIREAAVVVDHIYFMSMQQGIHLPKAFFQAYEDRIKQLIEKQGKLIVNGDANLYLCRSR